MNEIKSLLEDIKEIEEYSYYYYLDICEEIEYMEEGIYYLVEDEYEELYLIEEDDWDEEVKGYFVIYEGDREEIIESIIGDLESIIDKA